MTEDILYRYRWQVLLLLLGLLFVGVGVFWNKASSHDNSSVEIINGSEDDAHVSGVIVVEVSGEVASPGVFELPVGSRVEDALKAADGLSGDADNGWVELSINRAAPLVDGQKIYIPQQGEGGSAKNIGGVSADDSGVLGTISNRVNVNTASVTELESLWGIGPVTAQNIIEQRPYSSVEELYEKGILKSNVWERNKDLLSVY